MRHVSSARSDASFVVFFNRLPTLRHANDLQPNRCRSRPVARSGRSYAPHELYLPIDTGGVDPRLLDSLIHNKCPLDRGKTLFRQGDTAPALHVVRSGLLKTFMEDRAGNVQVVGFHLPGEILGMGGLGRDHYIGTAEALERSIVCEIRYQQLQPLLSQMPALHQQLARFIDRRAEIDQGHLVMMGRRHAQERLAMFLRGFADRYARASRDPRNLFLPMSRSDLASYLGLAMETVSRLFGRMEADGILALDRKMVRILRPGLLADLCADDQPMLRDKAAG